jgi:hypothetical protein
MKNIKQKAVSTKNFVKAHKVAVTVVVTSAIWITINRAALKGHNEFLKEKGLWEEFYMPTNEELGLA